MQNTIILNITFLWVVELEYSIMNYHLHILQLSSEIINNFNSMTTWVGEKFTIFDKKCTRLNVIANNNKTNFKQYPLSAMVYRKGYAK